MTKKNINGWMLFAKDMHPSRYLTDRFHNLLLYFQKNHNFKIKYGYVGRIPKNVDVVVTFQRLYSPREAANLEYLADLNPKTKLIGYLGDFDSLENRPGVFKRMIKRYDLILSMYKHRFEKKYPELIPKTIYFPNFFAPHERYVTLKINPNPIDKILVSGRLFEPKRYPFRVFVSKNVSKKLIDIMPHPKGHPNVTKRKDGRYYIGDRYAKRLNQYLACFTDHGLGCVLTKYMEIPAAGSLLVATESKDLITCGFVPGEHYVKVDKNNIFDVFKDIVGNPAKYEDIRKQGMKFVRANHSVKNRYQTLYSEIEKLLGG